MCRNLMCIAKSHFVYQEVDIRKNKLLARSVFVYQQKLRIRKKVFCYTEYSSDIQCISTSFLCLFNCSQVHY